jgi:hypothetical protein
MAEFFKRSRAHPERVGSGRKPASKKSSLGSKRLVRTSLPNARISISNLLYLGPRKTEVFLGFWGLSKVNATFIWDILKQVSNPTF